MKQVFHHYTKWEEWHAGMWRKVPKWEEAVFLRKATALTNKTEVWGKYMLMVLERWPISCEQNLTNASINRVAWIGQAACCLWFNCPEYIVRLAWWKLSDQKQIDANKKADDAILKWEKEFERCQNPQLELVF